MTEESQCPECAAVSRRGFLLGAAAIGGAAVLSTTISTRVGFAASGYAGDTLVVISLRGGFDGLSAVVPAGDPNYLAARPTIGIPQSALLGVDSMFGLHPAMAALLPYWNNGTFGAVHAVGQPAASRSHFDATDEMERAAPNSNLRTGWIDRALGQRDMNSVFSAVQVGWGLPTKAFFGPHSELSMGSLSDFNIAGTDAPDDPAWARAEFTRWKTALTTMNEDAPTGLREPTATALQAVATTSALAQSGYSPSATYPEGELGDALKDVARLIKADVGVQVACVDVGNWDMHEGLGQFDDAGSWMTRKLRDLSECLAAFASDLGNRFSKTVVVTMSEFGRRVAENASGGVDHGLGNAMLLLGGSVRGGRVHGVWPGLEARNLDDGDLAGANDFRVVLGEILSKRCGQTGLASVFPGADLSRPLGVVSS